MNSLPERAYAYNWISAYLAGGRYQQEWEAVLQLCCRQYWTRLWIIQEIISAERLVLCCGYQRLGWEKLSNIRKQITHIPTIRSTPHELLALSQTAPIKLDQQREHKRTGITWSLTLHNLLQAHAHACCSDPRDKVFGLLGLAIGTKITVDYSKTLAELHAQLLDELSDAVDDGSQNMLLTSIECWDIFGSSFTTDHGRDQNNERKTTYSQETRSPRLHCVTGIYGGTITELAQWKGDTLYWQSSNDEVLRDLPNEFSVESAFARFRFDSSSLNLSNVSNEDRSMRPEENHQNQEDNVDVSAIFLQARMLVRGYQAPELNSHENDVLEFRATYDPNPNDKAPSRSGSSLAGCVCQNARVGDILCRFKGVDVVVVLRQTNDSGLFCVIGYAMIHHASNPQDYSYTVYKQYVSSADTKIAGTTPSLRTQILPTKSFAFEIPDQYLLQSSNAIDLYLETPVLQLLTFNVPSSARPPVVVIPEIPHRAAEAISLHEGNIPEIVVMRDQSQFGFRK